MMRTECAGLYVHIPFCIKKCRYCDFLSFPAGEGDRRAYAEALVREMESWREEMAGRRFDTVFIGGGTPSALALPETERIFEGMRRCFSLAEGAEITVECNPGTVSGEKLRFYREAGVNRLSLGLQSSVERELKALGRIHSFDDFLHSYELAREAGFSNINVDVMSAVPHQTTESYEATLRRVTALSPEHISSYSLMIEEGTPFYEEYGENPPVDEQTDRIMYERTKELLAASGYERYEISNYAREGRECRHNLKYWRRGEYLGVGLGAASFLGHSRFSNERNFSGYMQKVRDGEAPVAEREDLTAEEERSEFMYLGLRCMRGVSKAEFADCFGVSLEECFGEAMKKCERDGLLEQNGDRVYLTGRGIDVSNRVFAEFI